MCLSTVGSLPGRAGVMTAVYSFFHSNAPHDVVSYQLRKFPQDRRQLNGGRRNVLCGRLHRPFEL